MKVTLCKLLCWLILLKCCCSVDTKPWRRSKLSRVKMRLAGSQKCIAFRFLKTVTKIIFRVCCCLRLCGGCRHCEYRETKGVQCRGVQKTAGDVGQRDLAGGRQVTAQSKEESVCFRGSFPVFWFRCWEIQLDLTHQCCWVQSDGGIWEPFWLLFSVSILGCIGNRKIGWNKTKVEPNCGF